MPSGRDTNNGFLFDPGEDIAPADVAGADTELATRLPAGLRLGTSSWTFPGWRGLVYRRNEKPRDLARAGLCAYCAHPLLRTVGLDRAFYAPMGRATLENLRTQTPKGFRFLVKAYEGLVRPDSQVFLDASYAIDVVFGPAIQGLGDRLGPLLLQFSPFGAAGIRALGGEEYLLGRIGDFLARVRESLRHPGAAPGPELAVELRDQELFRPRYAEMIDGVGVGHAFNEHPTMPPVVRQAAKLDEWRASKPARPGPCIVRWMLHRSLGYETARERYAPYDRIVDRDDKTREEIAVLALRALARGSEVTVIVNNKAEGSAPASVFELARRIDVLRAERGEAAP